MLLTDRYIFFAFQASSPTIQPSPLTNKSLKIYDEHGKLRKDAKPYSGTSSQLYQNHPLKLMVKLTFTMTKSPYFGLSNFEKK